MKNKFPLCWPKRNVVCTFAIVVRIGAALFGFHIFKEEWLLYISRNLTLKNPWCFIYMLHSMCITWFSPRKCMLCLNSINVLSSVMETQIFTVLRLLVGRTSGLYQGKPISIFEHSCGIFGGPSDTRSRFSLRSSIFRCQYHSTNAAYLVSSSC